MKYYKICYPDKGGNPVEETLSEQNILDHYWDFWSNAMLKKGKGDLVSPQNCIDDWIVVNWAWGVDDDGI